MDTTTLKINAVCNAGCRFCELGGHAQSGPQALQQSIAKLSSDAARGAKHLRIGGGEPLLERQLTPLIIEARRLGYASVTVETNGMVASLPGRVDTLIAAGLTRILWAINSSDSTANAETYRLPEGHAASVSGMRAFAAGGIPVIARTPLSVNNLQGLSRLPKWLRENVPTLEAWWLRPLIYDDGSQYDATLVPSLPTLATAIEGAFAAARAEGIEVFVEDDVGLPLCLFTNFKAGLRHLQHHPHRDFSASHDKRPACFECAVRSECPGQPSGYTTIHGDVPVKPFTRYPPALATRASRPETTVIYDRTQHENGTLAGPQVTIRVHMPCNQACTFCFVNRTSPNLAPAEVLEAIDQAAQAGATRISFSGGEPTLHPSLVDYVARVTAHDIPEREIQTNALLLTDEDRVKKLVDAGLTQAVVSLHAVDVDLYQAITRAGTPDEVITGVRNLLDHGVRVELNIVHNQANVNHLSAVVDEVARRIPEAKLLFSVTFIVEGLPRAWAEVALRYTEAVPSLAEAMRRAREHGLSFRLTGRCGTPPCVWKGYLQDLPKEDLTHVSEDTVETSQHYFPFCSSCAARSSCYGINRAYMARFGESEFSPISESEWTHAREPAV